MNNPKFALFAISYALLLLPTPAYAQHKLAPNSAEASAYTGILKAAYDGDVKAVKEHLAGSSVSPRGRPS